MWPVWWNRIKFVDKNKTYFRTPLKMCDDAYSICGSLKISNMVWNPKSQSNCRRWYHDCELRMVISQSWTVDSDVTITNHSRIMFEPCCVNDAYIPFCFAGILSFRRYSWVVRSPLHTIRHCSQRMTKLLFRKKKEVSRNMKKRAHHSSLTPVFKKVL